MHLAGVLRIRGRVRSGERGGRFDGWSDSDVLIHHQLWSDADVGVDELLLSALKRFRTVTHSCAVSANL